MALGFTLRHGRTYRVYDGRRLVIAIGGNYVCDGAHRRPYVDVYDRTRRGRPSRVAHIPLPHVRFYRCYRFRHIGAMHVYRAWHRGMRRLCGNPAYR